MSGTGDSSFKKISLLLLLDIISINYVLFYKFSSYLRKNTDLLYSVCVPSQLVRLSVLIENLKC